VNFSLVEPEFRGGLYINLAKKLLQAKVKDAYPVLEEFNAVKASFIESASSTTHPMVSVNARDLWLLPRKPIH
jgi:hypothetical protein